MRRAVRLRHLLWPPFRLSFGSGLGRCGKKSSFLVFVKLSGLGARARCVEQSRFRGPLLGLCDDRVIAARRSQFTLTPLTRATSPQLIIPDSTRRIHGRNTCPCLCWASTPRRIKCSPFVGQVPGPCLALTFITHPERQVQCTTLFVKAKPFRVRRSEPRRKPAQRLPPHVKLRNKQRKL